jgi:type IV pilus assembly protein PilF
MSTRTPLSTLALLASSILSAGCLGPAENVPDPKSQATFDVAVDEFKKGHLREALSQVGEALKQDANNGDAALLGAHIYLAFCAKDESAPDCRFADAERLARLAVDKLPESREAKNTLGVVLVHRKLYPEAIQVLKALSEDILYESPQLAWGNLGWAYFETGEVDLAIDALRRSIAAQPNFCVGNYRLGLAYEKKGDLQAARGAFTRAIETDRPVCKRIQEVWEGRARVARQLGATDEARSDSEQCKKLAPTSASGARCATLLAKLPAQVVTDGAGEPRPEGG